MSGSLINRGVVTLILLLGLVITGPQYVYPEGSGSICPGFSGENRIEDADQSIHTPNEYQAVPEPAPALAESEESDLLPFVLLGSGVLLLETAGITGSLSPEVRLQGDTAWEEYQDEGNLESFYSYQAYHSAYTGLNVSSYVLWGLGASAVSSLAIFFPQETFSLSPWGRVILSAGLALAMAGNVFSYIAADQRIENLNIWEDYTGAGNGSGVYYYEYQDAYTTYSVSRVLSYTCWGLGGLGILGAFLIPGEREPLVSDFLDRILIIAGMALITGGNYMSIISINAGLTVDERWESYENAPLDSLLSDYEDVYDAYVLSRILSYGLWIGGGLLVFIAVLTPAQSGQEAAPDDAAALPLSFGLTPLPDGIRAEISVKL